MDGCHGWMLWIDAMDGCHAIDGCHGWMLCHRWMLLPCNMAMRMRWMRWMDGWMDAMPCDSDMLCDSDRYRHGIDMRQRHLRGRQRHLRGRQRHLRGRQRHLRGRQQHLRGRQQHLRGH